MKKLLFSAAFILALNGYAAAQSTTGTTTSATKTEAATQVKKAKPDKVKPPKKMSRKERKAAAAAEAQKSVKISVPKPDMKAADSIPPVPKQ